jgi:hypothetical protein
MSGALRGPKTPVIAIGVGERCFNVIFVQARAYTKPIFVIPAEEAG